MAQRLRRGEPRRRRWPFALFVGVAGLLLGLALWAHTPDMPAALLTERYAGPQSSFLDVGGVRTHVRDTGPPANNPDAIPLILIHGSLESLHVWDDWTKILAPRARVITVDLPGHGLTGTWARDEYTIDAYADFIEGGVCAARLGPEFISVGSLTKVQGLFALKCGWAVASPEIIARIHAANPQGDLGVSKQIGRAHV